MFDVEKSDSQFPISGEKFVAKILSTLIMGTTLKPKRVIDRLIFTTLKSLQIFTVEFIS